MSNALKYRLLELKTANKFTFKELATKCQVTERSIMNWCEITIDSYQSIPSDKLRILSEIFQITMEDMYHQDLVTS
jgi:transcriptional regulator with XRE-family HTH domain